MDPGCGQTSRSAPRNARQDLGFGVAEAPVELLGAGGQAQPGPRRPRCRSERIHSRQPIRNASRGSLSPSASRPSCNSTTVEASSAVGFQAEADVAAGETESGASEHARVPGRPRSVASAAESLARTDQIRREQLMLAELQQQRPSCIQIAVRKQCERATQMRGGLLVVVPLGGRNGRR